MHAIPRNTSAFDDIAIVSARVAILSGFPSFPFSSACCFFILRISGVPECDACVAVIGAVDSCTRENSPVGAATRS